MLNCKLWWRSKVQLLHIHSLSPSEPSPIDTYPSCIPNANAYLYTHKAHPILQQSRLFTTHRYAVKIQVASNFPYCKFISRSCYYTLCTCRIIRHFTAEDSYLQLFLRLHIAVLAALCNPQPNLSAGTCYLSLEVWGWQVLTWGHRQVTQLRRWGFGSFYTSKQCWFFKSVWRTWTVSYWASGTPTPKALLAEITKYLLN